ncbi:MAG TPA: DUF202 domain-containing protein [Aeromonadales bacterium]|nr:DUF202 domain-containing protein [Aeromonadales bacterium]
MLMMLKQKKELKKLEDPEIDPKNLMAIERATTALIGTSISLIILGFVIEKFELFLHLINVRIPSPKITPTQPNLPIEFYNTMGLVIVAAGIILALYTYRYYTNWIKHLQNNTIDTDKQIYFILSVFVALIGVALFVSMLLLP